MDCPQCGVATKVKETRTSPETTFRQRKCPSCDFVFRTKEVLHEGSITAHVKRQRVRRAKKKEKPMDAIAQEMVSKMILPKPPVIATEDFKEQKRRQQAEHKARIRDLLNRHHEGGLFDQDDYD